MVAWADVVAAEPELAAAVRRAFAVRKHATLATLRRDGAPRISGTEVDFSDDEPSGGEVHLGSMAGARKAQDLQRDPRLALHSPTEDPPDDVRAWAGDGKIAGRAVELPTDDGTHLFRVDVEEVVWTRIGDPPDHLLVDSWRPGRGFRRDVRR